MPDGAREVMERERGEREAVSGSIQRERARYCDSGRARQLA